MGCAVQGEEVAHRPECPGARRVFLLTPRWPPLACWVSPLGIIYWAGEAQRAAARKDGRPPRDAAMLVKLRSRDFQQL